jgi:hypothetical protein
MYLLSRISHARGPRLDAVDAGKLGIRSINVIAASLVLIDEFCLQYPVLEILRCGGWPDRPGIKFIAVSLVKPVVSLSIPGLFQALEGSATKLKID